MSGCWMRSVAHSTGVCEARRPAHATGAVRSRRSVHALGAVRPIDGFRGRGVALKPSFRRAPLAGIGRSLPREVTP
jgi:hypothetical protein